MSYLTIIKCAEQSDAERARQPSSCQAWPQDARTGSDNPGSDKPRAAGQGTEENSKSSRDRRRYTDQIERLQQQLDALRSEYEVASAELHRLRRDRDDYHDEAKAAEAGLQRQQGEVAQREEVIARLTDQVQKLRTTLEDRDSRLEELRAMLENRNDEVAAMEERVTHTRRSRS